MKTNAEKLKWLADTVVLASEDLTKGRIPLAHALLQKGLDAVGTVPVLGDDHEAFKVAMVAANYPENMFEGFLAEGELTYYDPTANQMYDAWVAGRAS